MHEIVKWEKQNVSRKPNTSYHLKNVKHGGGSRRAWETGQKRMDGAKLLQKVALQSTVFRGWMRMHAEVYCYFVLFVVCFTISKQNDANLQISYFNSRLQQNMENADGVNIFAKHCIFQITQSGKTH